MFEVPTESLEGKVTAVGSAGPDLPSGAHGMVDDEGESAIALTAKATVRETLRRVRRVLEP